nr:extracellular solute-binding protein [Clostridium sp.]
AFTEKTGVKVEFINLKGELADRVRSEKDNPQADIMFGGDEATYMVLKGEGCYEKTTPSWAADVADSYKDPEGYWYGTYRTPMVLCYNTEAMSAEEAPADWADLAKPEYKDKIITRDSLSSSMRSTIVSLVQYNKAKDGEDAAWDYIRALNENIKNYYNSGSMMFTAVGKGEAAVSMAVINDCMKNRDENGLPLEMVIPESGAVVITDCIAMTKNAPHPNAAEAFIDFVGSEECQKMTANDFNRMPITDGFLADCPAWMQTEFSALDVDWNEVSANQSAWLEKWETDYIDAGKQVAKE